MKRIFLVIIALLILPVGLMAASSDSQGTNILLNITSDGGTTVPTRGCTDAAASNYNADATQDDGSCIYPVPNVSNFQARLNSNQTVVNLSWQNPAYPQLEAVRIVRGVGTIPLGPNNGTIVYEGIGESAIDNNIELDKTYYYVAFVRSSDGRYSSGVIAIVTTRSSPPDCVGDDCESGCVGDQCDREGGGGPIWPKAPDVDPIITRITLADFKFVQPGEPIKLFRNRDTIRIKGDKPLTVWIEYDLFPETLKTIVITLHDPNDRSKTFSFLLRADEAKTRYTGTIGPLLRDGVYPVTIHILNFQDQSLRRIQGRMLVSGVMVSEFALPLMAKRIAVPLLVGGGAVAGASQLLGVAAHVSSLYDLYLLVLRGFGALLGFLGIRRKSQPWGTVYDAITKRPIDPAYIVVSQNGQEVTTAITDIDGRYGFFLPPGEYDIKAGKTHYHFPSQKLAGRRSDELYDNLYFGEKIEASGEEVIARNIPLDPVGFDWNEFIKNKAQIFRISSRRELLKTRIINTIYAIGFLSTLIAVLFTPTKLNLGMLAVYIILYLAQAWWQFKHKVVQVRRIGGEPIPFAIVTAFIPDIDQRIKSLVTDHLGRFYLLLPPNDYYLTVEEKQPDGNYRLVHRTGTLRLKKGVLNEDLVLPEISPELNPI